MIDVNINELQRLFEEIKVKQNCDKVILVMSHEPSYQLRNFIEENGYKYHVVNSEYLLSSNQIYIIPDINIANRRFDI